MDFLTACILLVTADTHSAGFVPRLFDEMYLYDDTASLIVAGDLVDLPGQWDRDWTRRMREYGIWGVPGNHDDAEGVQAHLPMQRVVCGDPEAPKFVAFGVDSERVLGSYGSGFDWARESYPDTPWVVITHRPFVSCLSHGREVLGTPFGREVVASLPLGSLVVAGHQHVWCHAHMEGWTQIVVSTGGGKRYECGRHLPTNVSCEYLPDYPTFVKVDLLGDELTIVGLTDEGVTERSMSILEGEFPPAP